jgi:hypothetical protein
MASMGRRSVRGLSIATTLLVGLVAFLIASTLATVALTNLHLSTAYYADAQGEMLARAAVTQFARDQEGAAPPASDGLPQSPDRVELHCTSRLPPEGTSWALPGEVLTRIDEDNSLSERTSERGCPPYCVALAIEARVDGRVLRYRAIVQRTWPYVLTAPGPVCLEPGTGGTQVKGSVCVLDGPVTESSDPPLPLAVKVEARIGFGYASPSAGGCLDVDIGEDWASGSPPPCVLDGSIDFLRGAASPFGESVAVHKFGSWVEPRVRRDRMVGSGFTASMASAFAVPPPPDHCRVLSDEAAWLDTGASACRIYSAHGNQASTFYLLTRDLNLTEGYNVIEGSAGNVISAQAQVSDPLPDPTPAEWPEDQDTDAGIHLENCVLRIDGNLDMSKIEDSASAAPLLTGNNATLIVNGDLVLAKALLNAGDQGMIIYCHRLLTDARGSFNGLIVARDGVAVMAGDGASIAVDGKTPKADQLVIHGGILVGGAGVPVARLVYDSESHKTRSELQRAGGLQLFGTDLEYDAKYLKRLHTLGRFTLLALTRTP